MTTREKNLEKKTRNCLRCGRTIKSDRCHRMCVRCRDDNSNRFDRQALHVSAAGKRRAVSDVFSDAEEETSVATLVDAFELDS